jgi:tight adherence protein C
LVVISIVGTAGLALVISNLLQPAPSLASAWRHLDRPGGGGARLDRRGGGRAAIAAERWLRDHPRLVPTDAQLRLIGRPASQHASYLVAAALLGLVLPASIVAGLQAVGLLGLTWYAPVLAGLAAAAVGPVMIHSAAVEAAATRRADLRHELSAYLDVVSMLLAGNTGYEGALEQAAWAGDGRLFRELRRATREADARGASHTDALHQTGVQLGIDELEQVAATASLSAAEGAPVAKTLAAKCATLRATLATEQETEARLRTSRLTTPVVGMALIFMALVIYPALSFS